MAKLIINTEALIENLVHTQKLCEAQNIELLPITKCVTSNQRIVDIFYDHGISIIGDTHLDNFTSLDSSIKKLLLIVTYSNIGEQFRYCDLLYCAELRLLERISALCHNKTYQILVPVDLGELREGINPGNLIPFMKKALTFKNIDISGIATNYGCLSGIIPNKDDLYRLTDLSQQVERELGFEFQYHSLGGTILYDSLENGTLPPDINMIRLGEAILLGYNTSLKKKIDSLRQDVFTLSGEIMEIKEKNTDITGTFGFNAFGERMYVSNDNLQRIIGNGIRKRALLDFGFIGSHYDYISPIEPCITLVANTHDHTVIDITDSEFDWQIGDSIEFSLNYDMLDFAFLSRFIEKVFV